MDLEGITLMKMSQTAKEKYCMIQFTCAIFKKVKQNINTENRLVVARGEVLRAERNGERGQKVQTSCYKTKKL